MSRIPPFARNLAILALVAAGIAVLNLQTSLATASNLVKVAFFIAVAVSVYLFWRDFGRREIGLWPDRAQRVFYGAGALFLVDLGWYFATAPSGRDLLAFFAVAAACVVAGIRTWRSQNRYG